WVIEAKRGLRGIAIPTSPARGFASSTRLCWMPRGAPQHESFALSIMSLLKSPFLPGPRLILEFIQRKRYARIAMREEQGLIRQWFLLCGQVSKDWLLNPQPAELQKLLPPNDRTWADPFLWKHGE